MNISKKYVNYIGEKILKMYFTCFLEKRGNKELSSFLDYCSNNIKAYKNKGCILGDYKVIDKTDVNHNPNDFVNHNKKIRFLNTVGRTSGTTGTPSAFLRNLTSIAYEIGLQSKYFGWDGKYRVIFRGERIFKPDERPKKIFVEIPLIKQMYVSVYNINDETLEVLINRLNEIPNKILWAYPSSAYLLADYCIRKNQRVNFEVVATSSETLSEFQAEKIEAAFNCKIKDWYGQAERVAAFYRCEFGHYHELPGYSCVEYQEIDDNIYEIVGSTWNNYLMPLVRMKTGDIVEIEKEPCKCGNNSGTNVKLILGRRSSYIKLADYKIPECVFGCLLKQTSNIIESQIINTIDENVHFKIVKSPKFNKDDEKILENVLYNTIPEEKCSIEYVDRIERGANGKFQLIINESGFV